MSINAKPSTFDDLLPAADQRNVLAVVPARGGSKGVPRKNMREIGGIPMVARVKQTIEQLDFIHRAIVSTDDSEIAATSGLDAPFLRPECLSGDLASATEVARHALESMEQIDGCRYDILLYLEPTAPIRRAGDIKACYAKLLSDGYDAVWTVSPVNPSYHPLKMFQMDGEALDYYHPDGAQIVARQQLEPLYRRNGICYALTRDCVLQHGFMGPRTSAVVSDDKYVSIDTDLDIAFVNFLLEAEIVADGN